jgi:cystathionine beta-lyase/cystathionine gamma-synthase
VDFETRAIHDGQEPDPATGSLTVPIYQTSTFVQEAVGEHRGYDYARVSNPTRTALQLCLASLEGAEHGAAFSSGLGATTTLMHLLNPGERVVAVADVYGGVYRMFSQIYEPKGYEFEWVPAEEMNTSLSDHLDDKTRIVWLETPTNPLLNIVDIRAAAEAAHAAGALVVVLRGLKTLAVRMREHSRNAQAVAAFLERHPRVEQVLYPGLPSHPGHAIAAHQMRDFGGMVSFLAESEEEAVAICARTRIFQLAESLGGVESLIEHPARMTHASTADAPFAAPRNLIRLSVGLESAEDLVADLEAALVRSTATAGA